MARRKPSSIVSPWLGASKNIRVAGKTSVNSTGSSEAQIDTGGGERDKVNETLMLGVAGAAGVTAATLGARAVATGRVVNPVAAVRNAVRNEKVVVHASPQMGLSRIEPRLGSNQLPEQNVMFGWDPRKTGMQSRITRVAGKYVSKQENQAAGSIYVARIKKSEITTPTKLMNTGQVVSRGSGKVVSEIPVSGKTTPQVNAELQLQLRLAGAPAKPDVSRVAAVAEKTKIKVRQTFMTQAQKDAARRKRIR